MGERVSGCHDGRIRRRELERAVGAVITSPIVNAKYQLSVELPALYPLISF